MKHQEIILDILGIIIILLSLYAYFFMNRLFWECTAMGISGLSLFVFKGSQIRKYIEKLINKYLKK